MSGSVSPRRVALVTGGTGGIGGGVVLALMQRDFDVVVSDRAIDPTAADDLKSRAAAETRLAFVKGDLANLDDLPRFVDRPTGPHQNSHDRRGAGAVREVARGRVHTH